MLTVRNDLQILHGGLRGRNLSVLHCGQGGKIRVNPAFTTRDQMPPMEDLEEMVVLARRVSCPNSWQLILSARKDDEGIPPERSLPPDELTFETAPCRLITV